MNPNKSKDNGQKDQTPGRIEPPIPQASGSAGIDEAEAIYQAQTDYLRRQLNMQGTASTPTEECSSNEFELDESGITPTTQQSDSWLNATTQATAASDSARDALAAITQHHQNLLNRSKLRKSKQGKAQQAQLDGDTINLPINELQEIEIDTSTENTNQQPAEVEQSEQSQPTQTQKTPHKSKKNEGVIKVPQAEAKFASIVEDLTMQQLAEMPIRELEHIYGQLLPYFSLLPEDLGPMAEYVNTHYHDLAAVAFIATACTHIYPNVQIHDSLVIFTYAILRLDVVQLNEYIARYNITAPSPMAISMFGPASTFAKLESDVFLDGFKDRQGYYIFLKYLFRIIVDDLISGSMPRIVYQALMEIPLYREFGRSTNNDLMARQLEADQQAAAKVKRDAFLAAQDKEKDAAKAKSPSKPAKPKPSTSKNENKDKPPTDETLLSLKPQQVEFKKQEWPKLQLQPTDTFEAVQRSKEVKAQEKTAKLTIEVTEESAELFGKSTAPQCYESGTFSSESSDDEEFYKRYGDNCVEAVGTADVDLLLAGNDAPTTIIGNLVPMLNRASTNCFIVNTGEDKGRKYGTRIHLPQKVSNNRFAFVNETLPALVPKDHNLADFRVAASGKLILGVDQAIPDYLQAGEAGIDTRKAVGAVQSLLPQASKKFAEATVNIMMTERIRCSMQSLFTRGFLVEYELQCAEDFDEQIAPTGLVHGDVVTIAVNAETVADQSTTIAAFIKAAANGHIMMTDTEVSVRDLMCMRLISAGPQRVATMPDSQWELLTTHIVCEEVIKWAVVGPQAHLPEVPQHANVTVADMRLFLFKLAGLFNRYEDFVHGFVRASALTTGKVQRIRADGQRTSFLINSMAEIKGTTMPASHGDNFYWRLLRAQNPLPQAECYKSEHNMLQRATGQLFGHLMAVTGACVSLSFSHVFQMTNMTGRILTNAFRQNEFNKASSLIQQMTQSSAAEQMPRICRCAAAYLPQISSISINPQAFQMVAWSGYGLAYAATHPLHSWFRTCPNWIWYGVQPPTFFFLGFKLDSNWGYTHPGVKGHFFSETVAYGFERHKLWMANLGTGNYKALATSDQPYLYEQYAAMAINTMCQETRRPIARRVLWVSIPRIETGESFVSGVPAEWDGFSWSFNDTILIFPAGRILSYDWTTDTVMAPVLAVLEQPVEIQALLTINVMTLFDKAGLAYDGVRTFLPVNLNLDDLIGARSRGSSAPTPAHSGGGDTGPIEPKILPAKQMDPDRLLDLDAASKGTNKPTPGRNSTPADVVVKQTSELVPGDKADGNKA